LQLKAISGSMNILTATAESGTGLKNILSDNKMLPTPVLMKAITKVTEQLGK
jgi:hypothetical protein